MEIEWNPGRLLWPACLAASCLVAMAPLNAEDPRPGYVAPQIRHEPVGDVRVVVPLTTDDKNVHAMKLRNITNGIKAAEQWQGKLDLKLVLYSRGVSLLQSPDAMVKASLDFLRSHGVQVFVCNNTLAENGIDYRTLYKVSDADIVPSGFLEVAYLQARRNYIVDPAN